MGKRGKVRGMLIGKELGLASCLWRWLQGRKDKDGGRCDIKRGEGNKRENVGQTNNRKGETFLPWGGVKKTKKKKKKKKNQKNKKKKKKKKKKLDVSKRTGLGIEVRGKEDENEK